MSVRVITVGKINKGQKEHCRQYYRYLIEQSQVERSVKSDWKSFRMEFKNGPYPFYITGTHLEKFKVTSLCRKLALYCCKINNSPLKPVCLIWGFFFNLIKKKKMFFFSVMKFFFFFIYRGNYFWKSSCLFCHTADFFFNCSIII